MNTPTRLEVLLLMFCVAVLSGCANEPSTTPRNLKLETIDHGPMRPKSYLYREVKDQ